MRLARLAALVGLIAVMAVGCAGPERKLGRGLLNVTEVARLGEMRRSIEQTAYLDREDTAFTTGVIRGFNRTVARTVVGAAEVATFPIPTPTYDAFYASTNRVYPDPSIKTRNKSWGGLVMPEYPVYPDNYKPGLLGDSLFSTDSSLGFSGGDVAPIIPGSRFRVFDN